jgi:hypothetical protein
MSSLFGTHFKQLFSAMKHVKSRMRMCLIDEHLEGCMQITATEINSGIKKLLKQKQSQICH